ncbi:MAG: leucine--tRNA ligase [Eubacteriales bacterium]|nr:leucine--tRNA ligase [Eubacteriales bacterium]
MKKYDHLSIEKKWQQRWAETKPFAAINGSEKEKYYVLIEFPYPSGQGLHVGHPRPYTALDIVARQKRLEGKNVLFPMGWDAFGLPTENFAIKNKIHPAIVTERNIARFKEQLQRLGLSFDWDREINTTDPSYYKWTQWIFLQLYKAGLAYKKEMSVNWCTSCKCVLANEEVVDGHCERCSAPVVHRVKSQWMLKITEYAEKLLAGLEEVDFIPRVKAQQRNWIGRSEGASLCFQTTRGDVLEVFTTRPDTLFGVTYMVMSPEATLLETWRDAIENYEELEAYRFEASKKSELERSELNKDKTGIRLQGVEAIHPLTGVKLPIFIADYVLAGYGSGAIMAVPGHDQRDYDFAQKFGLPIVEVVSGGNLEEGPYVDSEKGVLVNSDFLDGLEVPLAKAKMIEYLEERGIGERKVNYKLRDWIFSRQRYWGEPIPMVHCEKCGWQAIDESELPLELPQIESYEPTDTGESPLAAIRDWVETTCPCCGGPAERETDTMPQWAGSSWYYLRYCDPHCETGIASPEALDYWMPVDWYNGGMEHTTLHLLYSRFWHKFLYDIDAVPCREPYLKRSSHGMILGSDGEKMSKSRGNVINPDELVENFGADTVRVYEMFIGDFEKAAPWNERGVIGVRRFLERVYALPQFLADGETLEAAEVNHQGFLESHQTMMNKSIKKVTEDIANLKMNTAVAQLMSLVNLFYDDKTMTPAEYSCFLRLLNPFAPHLSEELYEAAFGDGPITGLTWPSYDEELCEEALVEYAIQINGRVKSRIMLARDCEREEALAAAKADLQIAELIAGKTSVKEIVVPGRLINIVVR